MNTFSVACRDIARHIVPTPVVDLVDRSYTFHQRKGTEGEKEAYEALVRTCVRTTIYVLAVLPTIVITTAVFAYTGDVDLAYLSALGSSIVSPITAMLIDPNGFNTYVDAIGTGIVASGILLGDSAIIIGGMLGRSFNVLRCHGIESLGLERSFDIPEDKGIVAQIINICTAMKYDGNINFSKLFFFKRA